MATSLMTPAASLCGAAKPSTRTSVIHKVRRDAAALRSRSGFAICSSQRGDEPQTSGRRRPADPQAQDGVWVDDLPAALGLEGGDGPADPNMWASKPAWCQPWSILSTGALVVAGGYSLSGQNTVVGVVLALPVAVWWWLFLVLVPGQYKEAVEQYNASRPRN